MPSVSGDQQRFMRMAYERRLAGHARRGDPKMPLEKLHEFTFKQSGAPERKNPRGHYGSPPVSPRT